MVDYKDFMSHIGYDVEEGSKFLWDCYGKFAYTFDWDGGVKGSASIIFDLRDQRVYEVQLFDDKRERQYRMINPDFKVDYINECKKLQIDPIVAFDDSEFVDLESNDDFLEKLSAVVNGWDYDDRITIPLDIPDDELLVLMKMAHERDLTFNEFVVQALQLKINEMKANGEFDEDVQIT